MRIAVLQTIYRLSAISWKCANPARRRSKGGSELGSEGDAMGHEQDFVQRNPPYVCEVGEHKFVVGRIPDEFNVLVSGPQHDTKMTLVERYVESLSAYKERKEQIAWDRSEFASLSIEYDGKCSVVSASIEGTRSEITKALFRELTIHAKFFLGDEGADAIYDDIIVEVVK